MFFRFAFWQDAIDKVVRQERPYDHPVITELHNVLNVGSAELSALTQKSLKDMLTARQGLSKVTYIAMTEQLEDFSRMTRTSLLNLCINSAGLTTETVTAAASHLGICHGLVNSLRSTPYLTSKNQLLIPQNLLVKHRVSQQDVLRGRQNVSGPAQDIASMAHHHLDQVKLLLRDVTPLSRIMFLPLVICERRLDLLRKCDYNIFDGKFLSKDSSLSWHLWKAKWRMRLRSQI